MALDADTLLDRLQLKRQLSKWRSFSILLAVLICLILVYREAPVTKISSDHIARIRIEGVIMDDPIRQDMLENLRENANVKAVMVYLDTPGGTAIGGEELYLGLKELSKSKPVVVLMRTICTSAGYMAAIGGDHILAREGTITGSVGVIMQSFELTKLAESLGITPVIVKSGPNKASPNPLEVVTSAQREMAKTVVNDFFAFFVRLVQKERKLSDAALKPILDGRILTGRQAFESGLVDGLGGEKEALNWLNKEHDLPKDMPIKTHKPPRDVSSLLDELGQFAGQTIASIKNLPVTLDGLVMIWQPATIK